MACGDSETTVFNDQSKKTCNGDCKNCTAAASFLDKLGPLTKAGAAGTTDRAVGIEAGLSN